MWCRTYVPRPLKCFLIYKIDREIDRERERERDRERERERERGKERERERVTLIKNFYFYI